jgi:hypothetical protein
MSGVVLAMLVLVARNADSQDRVSARRGRTLAEGHRVVWLVVLAVISVDLSLVVGAGVSCIAGLRCTGPEHAGMDCGSCFVFDLQRMATEGDNGYIRVVSGRVEGLVSNGWWWMNAC